MEKGRDGMRVLTVCNMSGAPMNDFMEGEIRRESAQRMLNNFLHYYPSFLRIADCGDRHLASSVRVAGENGYDYYDLMVVLAHEVKVHSIFTRLVVRTYVLCAHSACVHTYVVCVCVCVVSVSSHSQSF